MNNIINVVCCGYRSWAINIINEITKNSRINIVHIFNSKNEYDLKIQTIEVKVDVILFLGWSWFIKKEITDKFLCLGIHPSDLPNYRGGSPIQHQIINGIKKTNVSLFTISEKLDEGDIWLKEKLDLSGNNMDEIFKNIETSSVILLNKFFNLFPNITPTQQDLKLGSYFKRRTPNQSEITLDDFKNKSLEDIYNTIRCLTDPYPNAYMQDSDGNRLVFKDIGFIKNTPKELT
jgi:methionyl-tRNA formyltransferase